MARKIASEEQKKLLSIIKSRPDGASIQELLQALPKFTSKRTVQYRLAKLASDGIVEISGSGKDTRYRIKESSVASTSKNHVIQLSPEALELKKLLEVPHQFRQHVSYQRKFLDSYVPNTTYYLTQPILERLSERGSNKEQERPAGTYARQIYQRLLIDLSWNSSRLEGNTYSLIETEKLLETGEAAPGKNRMETQMILNHKEAIEYLVDLGDEIEINRHTILNLHGLLSYDLLMDPRACGRLRTLPVKIGKSVYHPVEVPQLIEEYFHTIVTKAAEIKNPFEQSFFLMIHLPYLQPFLDVNKRVSRLAGNIPFIRDNLSPVSFVDVPESDYTQGLLAVYEFNRIELFRDVFVWAYERSASLYMATLEALGDPDEFKIRYRELIRSSVCEVVQNRMNKREADRAIQSFALQNVAVLDRPRFVEIVEIEVMSLHEGNFARFRIRPSEFYEWEKNWS